ncbi:MAG: hypothetical protein J0L82_03525 [Deltaproteobacteria bacterium]|nr:hypothetical protein [Deltaproteobacteria bacterium]
MKARLRKLPIAMAIGALVIAVSASRNRVRSAADESTQSLVDSQSESPFEAIEADVDGIAKSKIEILKNQGLKSQALIKKAAAIPGKAKSVGSAKTVFDAREEADAAISRLIATRKCERMAGSIVASKPSGNQSSCPTDHPLATSTPSGYSDLLTQKTVNELAFLKQLAVYARSERQADPFNLLQVAKVYIQHSDDNVKEQALEIAALFPARDGKEALKVAAKAMESTVSGPLAQQALSLLSIHRDHDPQLVDRTVTAALKDGGWNVRDAIASQLLLFITPSTRADFAQILASEPARSKVALHIRLNLEEFDRMERL